MFKAKNVGETLHFFWQYEHRQSISELAKRLGVPRNMLYRWRRGQAIPQKYWPKILEVTGFDCSKDVL